MRLGIISSQVLHVSTIFKTNHTLFAVTNVCYVVLLHWMELNCINHRTNIYDLISLIQLISPPKNTVIMLLLL